MTLFHLFTGQIVSQGTNILLFGEKVSYSQKLNYRWPNKTKPVEIQTDLDQHVRERINRPGYAFFWYKAECTPDAAMVVRNLGGVPGLIAASCAAEKFEFIEGMATSVNHGVLDVIEGCTSLPFNVLSTDYVTDDIIGKIVDLNRAVVANEAPVTSQPASLQIEENGNNEPTVETALLPGQVPRKCESSM